MTDAVIYITVMWFLYDNGLRHERVKDIFLKNSTFAFTRKANLPWMETDR